MCIAMTAIAGIVAGCGEPGVKTITTPPGEGGNRSKLQALEEKGKQIIANPKLGKKRR
jgi:hypothetical protein